jgi:hypothetical protein
MLLFYSKNKGRSKIVPNYVVLVMFICDCWDVKDKTGTVHILNTEVRSYDHFCSRKARKYDIQRECVALVTQREMHMSYCHLWPLWL